MASRRLDVPRLRLQARRFLQRAAAFVKPAKVFIPITIDQVLSSGEGMSLVDQFNTFYCRSGTPGELSWRGDTVSKNPCDLWMVVELFQRVRPSVVVETGTHMGGSASFYADVLRMLGIEATVITIDINPKWSFDPERKGITSIVGYSTGATVHDKASRAVAGALAQHAGPVMVMLDSDHREENVTRELELYAPFVTVGSYLIVEDTNVNGHPSSPGFGPGPWEAVEKFLSIRTDFQADRDCERFLLTFHPRGWLKRLA
jgi:cephalosporin hydroxylase